MAQLYSASDTVDATSATTVDLMRLIPGSGAALQIMSIYVGQDSDVGDAAAEMLHIGVYRSTNAGGGTGGAAITGQAHEQSSGAADATCRFGDTAASTVQTLIMEETANAQAGWFYNPVPEERLTLTPGGNSVVVHLASAAADALDLKVRVTWAEIG